MNKSTWRTKYSLALITLLLIFSIAHAEDSQDNLTASIIGEMVPAKEDAAAAAAAAQPKLLTRDNNSKIPVGAALLGAVFDKPYTVRGTTYYRLKAVKEFHQEGIASWYGKDDHGKGTASGERYNMFDRTAAHKQLPIGSLVRVDCQETGRSVVVRINDRGPHVPGRIIDLSYAAAMALNLPGKGLTKVSLTLINGNDEPPSDGYYAVQVASYTVKQNAEEVASALPNAAVESATINGSEYFRVKVRGFTTRDEAAKYKQDIAMLYPTALIIGD